MKKIIISRSQLKAIQEANNSSNAIDIAVNAADNSASGYDKAISDTDTQADIQKASVAGDVNLVVRGPKTTDNMPTVDVDVPKGSNIHDVFTVNPAIGNAVRDGAGLKIHGDEVYESTVSKKTLEEMRMANMRKNGSMMTKRQIKESVEAEMGLKNKLGSMNAFQVMDAYKEAFGDEALQSLGYEYDMIGAIAKAVMSAPEEQKNIFMSCLDGNGKPSDEEPIDLDIEI